MNIFQRIINMATKRREVVEPIVTQLQFNNPWGLSPDVDYRELIERHRSWVYACVAKISATCAQTPIRAYETVNDGAGTTRFRTKATTADNYARLLCDGHKAVQINELLDHPILDLMETVNAFKNGFEMMEELITFLELTGDAYLYVPMDNMATPSELWVLPSQDIKIIPSKETFVDHYLYGRDPATQKKFSTDEVIHFRLPNPKSLYYGRSPLQAALQEADLDRHYSEFETSLLENRASPDIYFQVPHRMRKEDRKDLRREISRHHGGPRKVGKFMLLDNDMSVTESKHQIREMSYLKGRENIQTLLAAIFGVPEGLLKAKDVNKANAESAERQFKRDTIRPILKRIEQKLNEKLVPKYDRTGRLFVAFDDPVPEDREIRLQEVRERLLSGYSNINEERALDNKPPVDWGEIPIMPMQNQPLGTVLPSMGGEQSPDEDGEDANPDKSIMDRPVTRTTTQKQPVLAPLNGNNRNGHKALDIGEGHVYALTPIQEKLIAILKEIGRKQKAETIEKLKTIESKAHEEELEGISYFILDRDTWGAYTATATAGVVTQMLVEAGDIRAQAFENQIVNAITGGPGDVEPLLSKVESIVPDIRQQLETTDRPTLGISLNVQDPYVQTAADARIFRFSFGTTDHTRQELRRVLSEGMASGENPASLINRVSEVFDDIEMWRAERIARTEWAWMLNEADVMIWKQTGVAEKMVWRCNSGCCEFCEALDGKIVSVGSVFADLGDTVEGVQGGLMDLAYETIQHPPLHAHCRCGVEAVLEEEVLV